MHLLEDVSFYHFRFWCYYFEVFTFVYADLFARNQLHVCEYYYHYQR